MELRDRVFGPIGVAGSDGSLKSVNIAALVRRLILFDHVYIETNLLREVPALLQAFGYKGLLQLIEDPDVDFISDAVTAGSIGQSVLAENRPMGVLPIGSFEITNVRLHEPGQQFEAALKNVDALQINAKRKRKLLKKLEDKLMRYPSDGATGVAEYYAQIAEAPESILPSIRYTLSAELGVVPPTNIEVHVDQLSFGRGFRVQSNLTDLFDIDDQRAHQLVERALLGIAGVNQRLEHMRTLNAMTGFQPQESVLLRSKLDLVLKEVDPAAQEDRFDRVVNVGGLPGLVDLRQGSIDVEELLKLRRHKDCVAMRQWLRTLDGSSDVEISQMFGSLHERMARVTHAPAVTVARWMFTTGLGILPHYGTALGVAGSAMDQFIMEKLIGNPGPVTFLSKNYRSIFK